MQGQYKRMGEFTIIKNNSSLSYINTPWNEKSLQLKSNEIIKLVSTTDLEDVDFLLNQFEKQCIQDKIGLSVCRVSNNHHLIKLQESGFVKTEISLEVYLSLKRIEKFNTKNKITLIKYNDSFLDELKYFAFNDFHFGRFLEDYKISTAKAKKRTALWIDDLNANKQTHCYIGISKEQFVGFMYYKIIDNKVELILGGVNNKYAHLAQEFWKEVINNLPELQSITTVISAANPTIINLYSDLGFKFKKSLIGLHKHREI